MYYAEIKNKEGAYAIGSNHAADTVDAVKKSVKRAYVQGRDCHIPLGRENRL